MMFSSTYYNISIAIKKLKKIRVPYKMCFGGSKFIVKGNIDYFPSNGRWVSGDIEGKGIDSLVEFLKVRDK